MGFPCGAGYVPTHTFDLGVVGAVRPPEANKGIRICYFFIISKLNSVNRCSLQRCGLPPTIKHRRPSAGCVGQRSPASWSQQTKLSTVVRSVSYQAANGRHRAFSVRSGQPLAVGRSAHRPTVVIEHFRYEAVNRLSLVLCSFMFGGARETSAVYRWWPVQL